jgi:hypothetical protein
MVAKGFRDASRFMSGQILRPNGGVAVL